MLRLTFVASLLSGGCLRILDEMNCAAREVLTLCVLGSGFSPTLLAHLITQLVSGSLRCEVYVRLSVCVDVRLVLPCGRLSSGTRRRCYRLRRAHICTLYLRHPPLEST